MVFLNLVCEISDKMPPIEPAWFTAIFWSVAAAGAYLINRWLAVAPVLVGMFFGFVAISDLFDPFMRPAIFEEMGVWYILQCVLIFILPVVVVATAAMMKRWYQRERLSRKQSSE